MEKQPEDELLNNGRLLGQNEKLKKENAKLWKHIKETAHAEEQTQLILDALVELIPVRAEVPPARLQKTGREAIRLSGIIDIGDVHYGEVVTARSTGGVAEYSPDIAQKRFDHVVDEVIARGKHNKIRSLWVIGGGDMISGDIHDDLSRSNEMMQVEQTLEMSEMMYGGLEKFCQAFPEVNFVGVSGNHARGYRVPFYNRKQIENYDYILYKMLEAKGSRQKNLNFHTPESFWTVFKVEDRNFLTMHGDTNKQQNSMSISFYSIWREMQKWKGMAKDKLIPDFDDWITHHLHTPASIQMGASTVFINGSLKGIDDYSLAGTRPPVPASQRFLTIGGREVVNDQLISVEHIK